MLTVDAFPVQAQTFLLWRIDEGVSAFLFGIDVCRSYRDDMVGAQHVRQRGYPVWNAGHHLLKRRRIILVPETIRYSK
jgi:hypothetical protein